MTRKATAQTPGGSARLPIRSPWPLLSLALAGLTACAQHPAEPGSHAQEGPAPVAKSVSTVAKGQQPVGYDVQELQRRLVALLARLERFDDVQPRAVQKALGVNLQPRAKQPLSLEGIGKLSNGWVFTVWAWQSEPNQAPWAPLQLYFYPGGDVDVGLWGSSLCFLDAAVLLAELQAAGYAVTGERSNFPLHSVQLVKTTAKAAFTVSVGDYRPQHAPSEATRCLRDVTVTTGAASSSR
jgi:TolA-binding protein